MVDRGWSRMSDLLDREMPKRRQRYLVPLILFGLLLAAGLSLFNRDGTIDSSTSLTPAGVPSESRTSPEAMPAKPAESAALLDSPGSEAYDRGTPENAAPGDYSSTIPGTNDVSQTLSAGKAVRDGLPSDYDTSLLQQLRGHVSDPSPGGLTPVDGTRSNEVLQPLPGVEGQGRRAATGALPVLKARTPAWSPILPSGAAIIPPIAIERSPRLTVSAYASTHWVSGPVNLQGVEGGLLLSYEIAPRWRLSLGGGYGHHNVQGLIQGSNADEELAFVLPADPDTLAFGGVVPDAKTVLQGLPYDTAALLVSRLNYLHIPLQVSYKLSRRFSAEAGVRMSFLLSAPVEDDLQLVTPGASNALLDLTAVNSDLTETDVVTTFDVAPTIGLVYRPAPRLELFTQYAFSLIPYIDRPGEGSRVDYNRSLALGIRYRIL